MYGQDRTINKKILLSLAVLLRCARPIGRMTYTNFDVMCVYIRAHILLFYFVFLWTLVFLIILAEPNCFFDQKYNAVPGTVNNIIIMKTCKKPMGIGRKITRPGEKCERCDLCVTRFGT